MTEFNNRIAAQRKVLATVNSAQWQEELFGLSRDALERWISKNNLMQSDRLVSLLQDVAGKLFFLANKSQEQITNEYLKYSLDVSRLTESIRMAVIDECRLDTPTKS